MGGETVLVLAKPIPPSSTYEWLCTIPMAASAGGVMCGLYEGSKNYNSVTQYALGTMESSMKKAASTVASTVAPVIQKLNKPIQVVDSYAASKLVNLGEKVPALKCEPSEVVTYLIESKKNLAIKITEGHTAISAHLMGGRKIVTGKIYSCKEALYSKISALSETISKSHAGVLVSEVKEALSTRLVQGKETLGSGVAAGQDKIQSGAKYLANSRAGVMVGVGIDYTLKTTERFVEYLIPELENEKKLFFEQGEMMKSGLLVLVTDAEGEVKESHDKYVVNRMEHANVIFRTVKLRMGHRFMQRLQDMQQYCKATLQLLKDNVDLGKMAHTAHGGLDKQYLTVTLALKDLEHRIRKLLSYQDTSHEVGFRWLSKEGEEEDNRIEWLTPRPRSNLKVSLDYAKQLGKIVLHMFQSVTVAAVYLPKRLKNGTGLSYRYAVKIYWTPKPIDTSIDPSASALKNKSILQTSRGYITQLGTNLSSFLQIRGTSENFTEKYASSEEDTSEIIESTDEDEFVMNQLTD